MAAQLRLRRGQAGTAHPDARHAGRVGRRRHHGQWRQEAVQPHLVDEPDELQRRGRRPGHRDRPGGGGADPGRLSRPRARAGFATERAIERVVMPATAVLDGMSFIEPPEIAYLADGPLTL